MSVDQWANVMLVLCALGQTLFVLLYLTFPWWRSFLGRALFYGTATFALLIDTAVLSKMVDWPHKDLTRLGIFTLLAFGIWWQFFAFLRTRVARSNFEEPVK